MKNIKNIAMVVFTLMSGATFAQTNLYNAKTADEIGKKSLEDIWTETQGPKPYQYVNERDIIFEKKIWETIPADQRANMIYFLPFEKTIDRKPLFDVIMDGVNSGAITEIYDNHDFAYKLPLKELQSKFTRTVITDEGVEYHNLGLEIPEEYLVEYKLTARDVKEYKIMGAWFFDRNAGELKYRLLGICPVVVDIATKGSEQENTTDLFWIFFPDAREVMYKNYAYNEANNRLQMNFDYLFNARKFNATIYQTDNVYGNYTISEYVKDNAMLQLLEAERIKESVRNFEDDLWNY